MILKYGLPILAIAGACLAVYTVKSQSKAQSPAPPIALPAASPYQSQVPGAGLVEPSTEFISIGAHVGGVVTKVYVKAGDKVKAGDPLFSIDDRALQAELLSRQALLAAQQSQLERALNLPRVEEVPAAEARVQEAQSQLGDVQAQLTMWENLPDKRAVSADEFSKRRFAVSTAQARLAEAQSQLALLKAGAWKPDLEIARANVQSATAEVTRIKTDIDRLTVRAPVDAEILKVNIRAGEFAQAGSMGSGGTDLMTIGGTDILHIRVDIDENDAWRVKSGAEGYAFVRGNSKLSTKISFVRFEPYVIPKKSLTGSSGERVDTRVLQAIYAFKHTDLPVVFVGQQMDVFLDAPPLGDAKFGTEPDQAERALRGGAAPEPSQPPAKGKGV